MSGRSRRGGLVQMLLVPVLFSAVGVLFTTGIALGATAANRLLAVKVEEGAVSPTVLIQTAEAVGYRYTVYDSYDPVRIVVDFPGMETNNVAGKVAAGPTPLRELRITRFEVASGSLARIEIVLDANTEYQVVTDDKNFRIVFPRLVAPPVGAAGQPSAEAKTAARVGQTTVPGQTANSISDVQVAPGQVTFLVAGEADRFEHFSLENPPRLVVDLYGVRPGFKSRTFNLSAGMRQLSVSAYGDKVRFVFDAEGGSLPEHVVARQAGGFAVTWGKSLQASAPVPAAGETPPIFEKAVVPGRQVTVESLDFSNRDGRSYVELALSSPANISPPVQDGNLIRFEVKNASIGRALRRPIDASAFPSAVRMITPYPLSEDGQQTVRIAVELKGSVPFALVDEGRDVKLVIDDGAFAEPAPAAVTTREMFADAATGNPAPGVDSLAVGRGGEVLGPRYTGQQISLVFDGADIRSILQLIGDVSGYNILAGPDIKGEITLRLIDVPWDQALKLVLDTMRYKSITEGNVMQIYTAQSFAEASRFELDNKIAQSKAADEIKTRRVIEINHVNMDSVKNLAASYDGVIANIDKNTKKVILSGASSKVDSLVEAILEIDRPERQVLIEARIVEASTNFSRALGVNWGIHQNNDDLFEDENVEGYGNNANLGLGGGFLLTPPLIGVGSGAALGVQFGKIGSDSLIINARLSALEAQGEVKVLSTPKITTLNGYEAKIEQGREIPYTTTSQDGANTEFKKANLTLTVTPEINPDNSMILTILVENNSPGPPVATSTGTQISIENKTAKTKLILNSGETTVVGGVYVESEDSSDSGVPYLKDIPYLGQLFKSVSVKKERRELLILITPRVIEQAT